MGREEAKNADSTIDSVKKETPKDWDLFRSNYYTFRKS